MTEPKHIPLPKRWSDDFHQFVNEQADRLTAYVVRVLDALVIVDERPALDDDVTEEEY